MGNYNKKSYFEKHGIYGKLCNKPQAPNLNICIVIPCHNEPDIISTLLSLCQCKKPKGEAEIIVVINHGENAPESIVKRNKESEKEINLFLSKQSPWIPLHVITIDDMPAKVSGVGLARKVGMDEAARRLQEEGIILCLDADCTVEKNYISEIENHFQNNKDINGCSISFAHPLDCNYSDDTINAIAQYELHLRYFIDMQRQLSLPFAYHTVGSSMAVVNKYYQQVGGMNKRKAGEDFYFIHKLIKQGKFSNCTMTTVFPSPRISDRVPFGTGKAMKEILSHKDNIFYTYNPKSFAVVNDLIGSLILGYQSANVCVPDKLKGFIRQEEMDKKINELKSNTSNEISYIKRMFHWFDAFKLMKVLHYLRDHYFPLIPVHEAVTINRSSLIDKSLLETLKFYRELDKQ